MIDGEYAARLMPAYLPRQRWFGAAERPVNDVRPVAHEVWRDEWPGLVWALVDADVDGIGWTRYQVFIGLRPLDSTETFLEGKGRWLMGDVVTDAGPALAYDAFIDTELAHRIFQRVAPDLEATTVRPLAVEQSNTSVVFDERWILKVFRRVHEGPNPDVEVSTALERVGFPHVPSTAAAWGHDGTDLAVVRRFVTSGSDGFELARTSLRDLYDARVPPRQAGGDFGPESARLGRVTAELHLALAEAFGSGPAEPARWAGELVEELRRTEVPGLPRHGTRAAYASLNDLEPGRAGTSIRIHGDLHLGQVLRGDAGWYVLDFEGEPNRPVDERRFTASPLRDVAGMLRSFGYAPKVVLAERGDDQPHAAELRALGAQWEARNRQEFLGAYVAEPGIDALLPAGDRERSVLLGALELGKAVYEVGYEHAHRPDWVEIPLGAMHRLAAAAGAGAPLLAAGSDPEDLEPDPPDVGQGPPWSTPHREVGR